MAVGHYEFNPQTPHGAGLRAALTALESGRDGLSQHVSTLIQMKDGGNLTDYAVAKYGFGTTGNATSALAELESAKAQLDGIAAALNQLFAKFR